MLLHYADGSPLSLYQFYPTYTFYDVSSVGFIAEILKAHTDDDTITRLERIVREAVADKDYDRIRKIVDNLCHDYAYAVHQPHTRNGGLIGLAATSIALGSVS